MTKTFLKKVVCLTSRLVFVAFTSLLVTFHVAAQTQQQLGKLVRIETARPGSLIPLFIDTKEGAKVTVLLLPGGMGGIGSLGGDGRPSGRNFLIRSSQDFVAAGFNVAMMSKPSDVEGLDGPRRLSSDHVDDIRKTLAYLKQQLRVPVWVVGTSLGSTSAATAGIALRDEGLIDGIVLTSSGTNIRINHSVPNLDLRKINVPTLVLHHAQDACKGTPPSGVSLILRELSNAPIKKQIMVNGGGNPTGDPCYENHCLLYTSDAADE